MRVSRFLSQRGRAACLGLLCAGLAGQALAQDAGSVLSPGAASGPVIVRPVTSQPTMPIQPLTPVAPADTAAAPVTPSKADAAAKPAAKASAKVPAKDVRTADTSTDAKKKPKVAKPVDRAAHAPTRAAKTGKSGQESAMAYSGKTAKATKADKKAAAKADKKAAAKAEKKAAVKATHKAKTKA